MTFGVKRWENKALCLKSSLLAPPWIGVVLHGALWALKYRPVYLHIVTAPLLNTWSGVFPISQEHDDRVCTHYFSTRSFLCHGVELDHHSNSSYCESDGKNII